MAYALPKTLKTVSQGSSMILHFWPGVGMGGQMRNEKNNTNNNTFLLKYDAMVLTTVAGRQSSTFGNGSTGPGISLYSAYSCLFCSVNAGWVHVYNNMLSGLVDPYENRFNTHTDLFETDGSITWTPWEISSVQYELLPPIQDCKWHSWSLNFQ